MLGLIVSIFANGRYVVAAAAWVAPILFLHAMDLGGVAVLAGVWLAVLAGMFISYRGVIPAPATIYPIIIIVMGTVWTLPYVAHGVLAPSVPGFAATLVFPLAWTTMEFLSSRLHPYGTWGSLAYTQYGNLPLMQVVSVTGIFGITFLVSWSSAAAAWLWAPGTPIEQGANGLILVAGVWLAALSFGGLRLLRATDETTRVAAIGWPEGILSREDIRRSLSGKLSEDAIQALRAKFRHVSDALLSASAVEAQAGAQILVWPEACAPAFAQDEDALLHRCREFAASAKVYLVAGVARLDFMNARPFQNHALLFSPNGEVLFDYTKRIPVPGFEAKLSVPGSAQIPVVETAKGTFSAAICYDLDFPHFIRRAGKANADFLLVPASDWREISHLHLVHAIYRGIETGTSLLRATRWGHTAAVDSYGRITALMDHYATNDRRMAALLPTRGVRTLYSRTGDLFAWSCLAGLVVIAALFGK